MHSLIIFLSLQMISAYYLPTYNSRTVFPPHQYEVQNQTAPNDTMIDDCLPSHTLEANDGSDKSGTMNLTGVAILPCADDKNVNVSYAGLKSVGGFVPGLFNKTSEQEMKKSPGANISDTSEHDSINKSEKADPKEGSLETNSTMNPSSIGNTTDSVEKMERSGDADKDKWYMCTSNGTSHKVIDRICHGEDDPLIEMP
ncbi:DNA-dependent ATPase protein rad54 [Puccinia graminis f. sp. tritici]|uniref:DNA-dependent ATPase protein rad54 n=1 Tax=Puccinia graminis f. sp. tritici TaxID=56615 RepID=A0A5B0QWM9_PUCGR|nr:DNA-dependent ATPase protein rad54 [Puccinia graminis f. sp. tritici]KAA1138054.1 DNA-dependent ATPase protein rad54 [Puccinia graminis f. sp. tritici]